MANNTIIRINTDANGKVGDEASFNGDPRSWDDASYSPSFSRDGTKVAFVSWSGNLVPGINNSTNNIYVKDIDTGAIIAANTTFDGQPAAGGGYNAEPLFSPTKNEVSFLSLAGNLVPGDTNGVGDIFIKDLDTEKIRRVSTDSHNTEANGASFSHVFSPDGTRMAFVSEASNLVDKDTNGTPDIFLKDLETDAVTRITTDSDGTQLSLGGNLVPAFSPDGTKIAFVDGLTKQAYVKDISSGLLIAVAPVPGAGDSQHVAFSPDGSELIFTSGDDTLVQNDKNEARDIFKVRIGQTTTGFVRDRADQPTASTSGALPLTDADVGDIHTVTVKPGDGAVGTLTATIGKEPDSDGPGSIGWTYTVDHKAVAGLASGQSKVETFTVTVDDGHGGTAEQAITITVAGSNDAPHIDQLGPFTRLSTDSKGDEAKGGQLEWRAVGGRQHASLHLGRQQSRGRRHQWPV